MAYINVAEWTPDQVTDWLKGLDDCMYNYVYSFTNNEVGGHQLLNIRPYELEQLGMHSIGHQELVLEAVEYLRNFHYNLDKENLQFMALHLATSARSLHRQLATHCDDSKIETQLLYDITRTIATIKPLIGWLERTPFKGQFQFTEICRNMLRLGLEMATIAQRDRFVERPVEQIRGTAEKLERLANYIIQDITDPMLMQPASLNLVTLKKRESELGFNIESNYHGIHRVIDIKYNSPAHNSCGKIEDGDEIVQINYQTIVGWQYKTVLIQLRESLPDVLLTLKKRPKHTKIYGQIYMQPYRLPSKKRVIGTRWGANLPIPCAGFATGPHRSFNIPLPLKSEERSTALALSDTDSSCSDILTPTDTKAEEKEIRLYYPKPRAMLQRRNTICGDELLSLKSCNSMPACHERNAGDAGKPSSPSLRDKSVSFGFGLEIAPRPTTCIGIGSTDGKFGGDVNGLLNDAKRLKQVLESQQEPSEGEEISKPGISKVVRFDPNMKYEEYLIDEKFTCNVENTILETFEPIPFVDEEEEEPIDLLLSSSEKPKDVLDVLEKVLITNNTSPIQEDKLPIVARRGRLDKSHSTPAYDNSGKESDTPPAIEPRKEFLLLTPPVPPPRPRKQKELVPSIVPRPPPKPPGLKANILTNAAASISFEEITPSDIKQSLELKNNNLKEMPYKKDTAAQQLEANELHTPNKTRILTLKKKHNLISKRRNVNLKLLGTGDIQGHLYRRTKNHRGVTFWARQYFVMLDTILYGFRSKDASKASCVIFLPGFTVSLAKEVHSKPYAFKVYHSTKTFYFATESQDALNQWVGFIDQAAVQSNLTLSVSNGFSGASICDINTKDLFSETESTGDENESIITKSLHTPSSQGNKDISCRPKTSTVASMKHEIRYNLGSLRKLTKGSLPFKSSTTTEKKISSDIPVPTEQYRSYRKVPGGSFGIQIGANTPGYRDGSLSSTFSTKSSFSVPKSLGEHSTSQQKDSISSSRSLIVSGGGSTAMWLGPSTSPAPAISQPAVKVSHENECNNCDNPEISTSKSIKKTPYNFIHASNPNLVEFDFQTSKTLDYSLPKINPSNSWDAHHNIQGFVTLKDLMLQKQEEDAQEMYNNRVLLGVEKRDDSKQYVYRRAEGRSPESSSSTQLTKLSKTQNRSLPKTPDYEISFKPDDEDIKRTRTKEGLKLRDFGYELISGDEPLGGIAPSRHLNISTNCEQRHNEVGWKSRHYLKPQQFSLSTHKSKKLSNNNDTCTSTASNNELVITDKRSSSFKKKGKFERVKTSSERILQFSKHSMATTSGMTMTLPLNKKSNHVFETNCCSGDGIKKSHTYNNDLKEKASSKYHVHRKNSAPMPIFSKLTFATSSPSGDCNSNNNKSTKENKMFSPLLHRSIFGHYQHQQENTSNELLMPNTNTYVGREYDREIFSQVIFSKVSNNYDCSNKFKNMPLSNVNIIAPDVVAPPPPPQPSVVLSLEHEQRDEKNVNEGSNAMTPDYPNMECPPVFEPEIYSLTDPNASLGLLLRHKNTGNGPDVKK